MNTGIMMSCFFSSRRRHTRWPRDWSSDVCSSDLAAPAKKAALAAQGLTMANDLDPKQHELAQWLTRVERNQTHPNQRWRDAATLILIDRSEPVPKVLLGRRHGSHKFLPGRFVFPGGRVERGDARMP